MKIQVIIDETLDDVEVTIKANSMNTEVKNLIEKLENSQTSMIIGYKNKELSILNEDKIVRILSEDGKVLAQTLTDEYSLKSRLYQIEEKLNTDKFIRISNSEIINIYYVEKFDMSYQGTIFVKFKNGKSTFVSRRYISKIKEFLGI